MKRWHWITIAVVVLGAIIGFSLAGGEGKGEEVYVEPVKRMDIESVVSAPGEIDPKLKVNISAHVIGKIERLYFEEGDWVEKGDRLVELERVNFEAARNRTRSELANRRIEVQRREINLADSRLRLDRAERLREQNILSQELYDQARLEFENAQANLASARESVRQAEAALAQAEDELQRTTIEAPISGKIVSKNAQEGEVVITGTMNNPGSVIAVLADLSDVLVQAEVGETEVVDVKVGQVARVDVDAIADRSYQGSVVEIGSSAISKTGVGAGIRYFEVKILLEDPDERLRPGMTAQVEVITDSKKDVLAVPVQSVVERDPDEVDGAADGGDNVSATPGNDEARKYVLLSADGKVDLAAVTTGISNVTHVEVTSGLEEGQEVITGPFRKLDDLEEGDAIQPSSESESADDEADEEDEEE